MYLTRGDCEKIMRASERPLTDFRFEAKFREFLFPDVG